MRSRLGGAALALSLTTLAGVSVAAEPPPKASPLFPVEYVSPRKAAYRSLYEMVRERHVLERLSEALGFIRLPTPLTLRITECGESNAWYEEETHTATFCYELMQELLDESAVGEGQARDEAASRPFVFIFLHEIGHALFHLLRVPILGREEDAADQVATLIMLRLGPEIAKETLASTARMYAHAARARTADESDFADVHALDAQRYYNVLCLAYGSDRAVYAAAVEKGGLPPDRAEGCEGEYRQVAYAVRKLIAPHVNTSAFRRTAQRAKARQAARTK